MANKYLKLLKNPENMDSYILLLLSLGYNPVDVSRALEVTRQTVYSCIKRNQKIYDEYIKDD